MACHPLAGPSRSCFHGVPLIVPVPVDERLKALAVPVPVDERLKAVAVAAHREAVVAAAGNIEVDSDDVWGEPLVEYLTNHR